MLGRVFRTAMLCGTFSYSQGAPATTSRFCVQCCRITRKPVCVTIPVTSRASLRCVRPRRLLLLIVLYLCPSRAWVVGSHLLGFRLRLFPQVLLVDCPVNSDNEGHDSGGPIGRGK